MDETQCPLCWEIETPLGKRIRRKVRLAIFGYTIQEQQAIYARSMSGTMSAVLGMKRKTWYDRHKEAFEKTGDKKEMERMLRHVKEGE